MIKNNNFEIFLNNELERLIIDSKVIVLEVQKYLESDEENTKNYLELSAEEFILKVKLAFLYDLLRRYNNFNN